MVKVLTFGVFDLLHIGHVVLFQKAKQLGDELVVAVQNDNAVLKYKPDASLFYTALQREFFVGCIKFVDEVVSYNDVDKDIKKIEFDILALGEDQNHAGFQAAIKWCAQHNKTVVVIHRTKGVSSSLLRVKKDL